MANKMLDTIGTILLVAGFILAFLPHALHSQIGLKDDASHLNHVIFGITTAIIALGILVWNNKALKAIKFK